MSAPSIPSSLSQLVLDRAQGKCEYCLIHQDVSIYNPEVDHIIARKHGGQTVAENLALSCLACNRHACSDLATFDPISNEIVPLFNPRRQTWTDHFTLDGTPIVAKSCQGPRCIQALPVSGTYRFTNALLSKK